MRFNDIPQDTGKTTLSCIFEDFDIRVRALEDDGYDPYSSKSFNPQSQVTVEFETSKENEGTLREIMNGYELKAGVNETLLFSMKLLDKEFSSGIITSINSLPVHPLGDPRYYFTVVFTKWEEYYECESCSA